MSKHANYFRIGVFVLVAIFLFVGGLVIFGAGQFFKHKITFETYEQGTVQGIDVGSAVKFRGVQIGQVTWIGFSFNTYPEQRTSSQQKNYVIIRMEIDKEIFPNMFAEDLRPMLDKGVQKGLRVRIEPQGITGTNYMEINYVADPTQYPLLDVTWTPNYYYIPSAPGQLTDILDSMNKIMKEMDQMNLADLSDLMKNLNKAVVDANIGKVSTDLQALITQINQALAAANVGPLSDDARKMMAGVQASTDQLQKVLKNIEPATHFNPEDIREAVRNLATISTNLEQFSASIKQRPSLLLYGTPPNAKPTPTPRLRR